MSVLVTVCALLLAACGGGSSTSADTEQEATGGAETQSESKGTVAEAKKQTKEVFAGSRIGEPPSEASPAVKGKSVWIVQAGASSPTSAGVTASVEEALGEIGWEATSCDGKLNPAVMANCYKQAIAAKPDGIVNVGVDCTVVQSGLEQAKAAGIITVPAYSFDCDEEGNGEALFGAHLSFGDRYTDMAEYFEVSGEDAAAWLTATTNGKAEVINLTNQEYTVLREYQAGFEKGMGRYCPSCELHEVSYLAAEFGPKLQAKTAAALTKYPNANAMQGTVNPELGPDQAVLESGREIQNIGGLGIGLDATTIQEEEGLTATIAQPLAWFSFAAVDTLNSVFAAEEPRDGGIGWSIFDAEQNLPQAEENYEPEVDFRAAYLKSWGV
ncbi:MAG: sugar ABC transporter substrate-binding protein [Solirubrobacterales bacterium]